MDIKSYCSTTQDVNFPSKRIVHKQLLLYAAQNCNWANLQNQRANVKEPLMNHSQTEKGNEYGHIHFFLINSQYGRPHFSSKLISKRNLIQSLS